MRVGFQTNGVEGPVFQAVNETDGAQAVHLARHVRLESQVQNSTTPVV